MNFSPAERREIHAFSDTNDEAIGGRYGTAQNPRWRVCKLDLFVWVIQGCTSMYDEYPNPSCKNGAKGN